MTLANLTVSVSLLHLYFPVSSASGCGVEGCPLDYGLSTVRSVQAVGGGGASRPGDGRRPAGTPGW